MGGEEGDKQQPQQERKAEEMTSAERAERRQKRHDDAVPSIIGWVSTAQDGVNDTNIPTYCSNLGLNGYSFVNYPIGGIERDQWKVNKNETPPPINLPDWQLKPQLWSVYVVGRISSWIDCDSTDPWLAELSARELEKEFSYMSFMPLRVLTLELKHRDSPRLAEILTKWLWTQNMSFCVWVFVATDENCYPVVGEVDKRDLWAIWADFRTLCTNYTMHRLAVGLRICADLADEFLEPKLYGRWNAEPLCAFWLDSSIFVHGAAEFDYALPHNLNSITICLRNLNFIMPNLIVKMSESLLIVSIFIAHNRLLSDLFGSMQHRILVCNESTNTSAYIREIYVGVIKRLVDAKIRQSYEASPDSGESILLEYLGHPEYVDALQIPLQPLADNLDSGTYTTFEEDAVKYHKYREAIGYAIDELVSTIGDERQIVVFLLGAGRGPLMHMIMDAEKCFNDKNRSRRDLLKLKLVAVEKNANAVVTLQYRNRTEWNERVTVIECDMRALSELVHADKMERPDLVVSELLGSFGDNELCPECLDGVNDIVRPTTISIPQKYTSYVAPIQSVRMHQKVLACSESKYFDRGLPSRGRLLPQKHADGSYKLPLTDDVSSLDEIYVVYLRSICALDKPKPVNTFKHPNFDSTPNCRQQIIEFEMDKQCEDSKTGEMKRTELQNRNGMSYYMRL
ncbi:unnamed protein product [Anisakis simplex]|uniref:Protein arginine N-methyltransferase n=1 Tax=Anisakis simplex TaxID=6269 RepID=A0A158PPK5_ANISI|nr:unnamed protein product [Anisakis simplex]